MNLLVCLLVIAITGTLVIKKFKAQTVLLLGGLIMMFAAYLLGYTTSFVEAKKATGVLFFDAFEFINITTAKDAANLGLMIMTCTGFAKYMDHIGASSRLVVTAIKPLGKMKSAAPTGLTPKRTRIGKIVTIMSIARPDALGITRDMNIFRINVSAITRYADFILPSGLIAVTTRRELAPMWSMYFAKPVQVMIMRPRFAASLAVVILMNSKASKKRTPVDFFASTNDVV